MIPPEIPENEAERLAALYQLNILDTEVISAGMCEFVITV